MPCSILLSIPSLEKLTIFEICILNGTPFSLVYLWNTAQLMCLVWVILPKFYIFPYSIIGHFHKMVVPVKKGGVLNVLFCLHNTSSCTSFHASFFVLPAAMTKNNLATPPLLQCRVNAVCIIWWHSRTLLEMVHLHIGHYANFSPQNNWSRTHSIHHL